jgi:uncharacterized protein with von Willebrand factor type A (vWA) domain
MKNFQKVNKALLQLSEKIGPEVMTLPCDINPGISYRGFTNSRGVVLQEKFVASSTVDAIEIVIAHEICHHVIGDHEQTYMFNHDVVNYADDYKINQFLEETMGYDLSIVDGGLLRDSKYDNMSTLEICEDLAGSKEIQGDLFSHPKWCANHKIIQVADSLMISYGILRRQAFDIDINDYTSLRKSSREFTTFNLKSVDVERARDSIAAFLYLDYLEHTCYADELERWEVIAYSIHPDIRAQTVGDPILAQVVSKKILERLDTDIDVIEKSVEKAENYLNTLLEMKQAINNDPELDFMQKYKKTKYLNDRIAKAEKRLDKVREIIPIPELLQTTPVLVDVGRVKKSSTRTLSLSRSTINLEDELDGAIPNIIPCELTNRIKKATKELKTKIDRFKEMKDLLNETYDTVDDNLFQRKDKRTTEELDEINNDDYIDQNNASGGFGDATTDRNKVAARREEMLFDNQRLILQTIRKMNDIEAKLSVKRKQKIDESGGMPTLLNYGSELDNVDASEFALLANPYTALQFFVRLSQGSLMQRSPEKQKQASVVICVDTSGSMLGERLSNAIAFMMAMARILEKQGRGMGFVLFHDTAYLSGNLKGDSSDMLTLIEIMNKIESGGTYFQPPVLKAFDIKEENKWKETNIILASDGDGGFSDPAGILAKKGSKDTIDMVLIGGQGFSSDVVDNVYKTTKDGFLTQLISCGKSIV